MVMLHTLPIAELQRRLFDWYQKNRRDLPWRGQTDPYAILVSEVMLQQTGVERVAQSYERFLAQFPTFAALASASRGDVLRAWAGLGYNRRAVYLQECAQTVVLEFAGELPSQTEQLRRLPGLGPYTIAAIQSFAYGFDVAALDTNLRRVLARLAGIGTPTDQQLKAVAVSLLPPGRSADWNQALMDFGSLQCTAIRPRCIVCPLLDLCGAVQDQSVPTLERKVAERPEPYLGSRRYFRGKIVAFLRDLPPGQTASLDELLHAVKPEPGEGDRAWLESLVRDLVGHGLAQIVEADEPRVAAPA